MTSTCQWARQRWARPLVQMRGFCSSSALSTSEKKSWYNPHFEMVKESWKVPVHKSSGPPVPKNEWRGFFHHFMPRKESSMDLVLLLRKGLDLRPSSIKKWWQLMSIEAAVQDQMYITDRVAILGYDLSAAHFIVHRGGKVRFMGHQEWVEKDEDGVYKLPRHYQPNMFIEEADVSAITNLVYEGIESMCHLNYLKSFSVAGCIHIDDWCIDRICGQYAKTLERLDISGCTKVTEVGVAALARLSHLRHLNLSGLNGVKNIELLCLLLEDSLPHVQIIGIDYAKPQLSQTS